MSDVNGASKLSEADERNYTSLGNILGIIGGFIPSLIFWLIYKDRSSFLDTNMKSALNFQITLVIIYIVGMVLTAVFIGSLVLLAAWVLNIVFSIMAFSKTRSGENYKYPMTISFIK